MSVESNRGRNGATFAAFLCSTVSMSAIFVGSFSVMLPAVTQSLGIGVATFTSAFTIVQYVTSFGSPLGGRIIDKLGPRPAAVGIAVFAVGLVILSRTNGHDPWLWLGAVVSGVGAAVGGPIAYVPVVSSWFSVHRGLALAVVVSMSPQLGQAIVAPLTRWLIVHFDWRVAYLVLAGAVIVLGVLPAALLLKRRPNSPEVEPLAPLGLVPGDPDGAVRREDPIPERGLRSRQVYGSRVFWTLTAADCLSIGAIIGTQTNLVKWLGGERAVSATVTTAMLSTLSVAGIIGVVGVGFIVDRVRSSKVLTPLYTLAPVGLLLLILSGRNVVGLFVGVVLLGAGMTAVQMLLPYLITRFFGLRATAEIYGTSLAANVLAIGTGPLLIAAAYDALGSYTVPMVFAVVATALSALLITTIGPYRFSVATDEALSPPAPEATPATLAVRQPDVPQS